MYEVGDIFEEEVTFTREMVKKFAEATGDTNPIHLNDEFAANTSYGRTIVHGTFVVAQFTKLFGTVYPGPGTIVRKRNVTFIRPVFVGETYKMVYKVVSISYQTHSVVFKCFLKNEKGKNCIMMTSDLINEKYYSNKS